MPTTHDSYQVIQDKIQGMKSTYPSLRLKSDDYVFSALCVKAHLYKNPALSLNDADFEEIIVDGQYDGGVPPHAAHGNGYDRRRLDGRPREGKVSGRRRHDRSVR